MKGISLMNDNTSTTDKVTYAFTLSFKVGGVIDFSADPEAARNELIKELDAFYGSDGYDILDFHAATEVETEAYNMFIASLDDTNKTIN